MNVTRSNVSLLYVVLIVALLALVSVSSYIASTNMEDELNSVVQEAIPLAALAENILGDVINQETGVRGFEVTSDERYLEPYEQGKAQLAKDLELMAVYQKKYPGLKSLMEGDIIPQIQKLQDHYSSQVELVRAGRVEEARARLGNGKMLMDRFRQLHLKIRTDIDAIGTDAYNDAQRAGHLARIIIAAGGAVAIIIGAFSAVIFNRARRAEAALRKSEETYRYMAESLEAQNEEIIAQQEEQEQTLEKLSQRELELEAISSYQEKLSGSLNMNQFLQASIPALLNSLQMDAALLVVKEKAGNALVPLPEEPPSSGQRSAYTILYAAGYPSQLPSQVEQELYGPAQRVFTEKVQIDCKRELSREETGLHQGMTHAIDQYHPLFDDKQEVIGFLLLTSYLSSRTEQQDRTGKGLMRQFGLAFLAQQMNEDRHLQSLYLEQLNEQLLQEKALIEEQRDLIESILESTNEGMMLCDSSGKLLFANHRMKSYFTIADQGGEDWNELTRNMEKIIPSLSPVRLAMDNLLTGTLDKLTERFAFMDQEEQQRYVELYATKVGDKKNQQERGYLFVFRDRTEEEKVDEMKNEFISIVSHELRTPLASVLGFIEILLHRQLPQDKQHKYMQTIYKEAHRLSNLINDFLDLQRMESGKQAYHFAPVELISIVREVAEQWKEKPSHTVVIESSAQEAWVRADADRLKQVAHNLISNAIKYSPQADKVNILIDAQDGQVKLHITDFGLGIPDEAKDKLFTKFYRVDNSDRRQIGGTGLGLAIVKEIVDAHGGSITFESAMGEGTTFTVQLDSYRFPEVDGSIIVLEDDDNLAKLIQVALSKLEIPIVHLRSAEEGIGSLHRIRKSPPRLCIVDIHLEGSKNGWDFMAELYDHPTFYRTPVIVSTALEPPLNYYEKDIEKFLRKPFSMEKLLQAAEQLLYHTESQPSYIFPEQDEALITSSLRKKGIEVSGITHGQDTIQIEPKRKPDLPEA
ncbi:ATP-binding protein [Paenibacillus sp. OAS669]|uniref:ATP-binding protein n=1 Tax=Paenibacillus sp. OAS669 TaxID=2663821 RepID=UPI0017895C8D|nr:ATP-binding protein [Paenibacillus sp. OAS669]MBE1443577.1 signal transduction histidine kinase/CHASE3 domain sensor protein/CheY-like chemotaxis protein [Paenibacillus sp. OAS669]